MMPPFTEVLLMPLDNAALHDRSLLTTNEVAEVFRLSAGRLRNLRYRGLGPRGYRLGKSIRYRLADVEAWLTAQADPPPMDR